MRQPKTSGSFSVGNRSYPTIGCATSYAQNVVTRESDTAYVRDALDNVVVRVEKGEDGVIRTFVPTT